MRLALAMWCACLQAGRDGDEPKADPSQRGVESLVDAWDRLRPGSRFRTGTGASTPRRQSRLTIRQIEHSYTPKQADRLEDAVEDGVRRSSFPSVRPRSTGSDNFPAAYQHLPVSPAFSPEFCNTSATPSQGAAEWSPPKS